MYACHKSDLQMLVCACSPSYSKYREHGVGARLGSGLGISWRRGLTINKQIKDSMAIDSTNRVIAIADY